VLALAVISPILAEVGDAVLGEASQSSTLDDSHAAIRALPEYRWRHVESQTKTMGGTHWWQAHFSNRTVYQVEIKAREFYKQPIQIELYYGDDVVGHCHTLSDYINRYGDVYAKTLKCDRVLADMVRLVVTDKHYRMTYLETHYVRVVGNDGDEADVCVDETIHCTYMKDQCDNDHVKEFCRKSCGTCCHDKTIHCAHMANDAASCAIDHVKAFCPKMCNACE